MLNITTHSENNKLDGFKSLNTSPQQNPFCMAMRSKDTICAKCYAVTMESRFPGLRENITANTETLSTRTLKKSEIPNLIMEKFFRFHSLGELVNTMHFRNFLKIVKANPTTNFTLWTKRADIVTKVLNRVEKPANLILIFSNPVVGCDVKPPKHFDKTFNVYPKTVSKAVKINCKGKCRDCLKCYTNNETQIIREVIK